MARVDKASVIEMIKSGALIVPIGSPPNVAAYVVADRSRYAEAAKMLRLPDVDVNDGKNGMNEELEILKEKNSELLKQLDDLRVINRAKLILVSHHGMTENGAHKYIEKRAMEGRTSRRGIAERILRTYDN